MPESGNVPPHVLLAINAAVTAGQDRAIAVFKEELATLKAEIKADSQDYVTQAEFWPVKTIVYFGAGTALLAVLGGDLAMVVRKG